MTRPRPWGISEGGRAPFGVTGASAITAFLAVAFLILPGSASAAAPGVTFVPPYLGIVSYTSSTVSPTACNAKGGIPVPPSFNNSSGKLKLVVFADAGHGPYCHPPTRYGSSDSSYGYLTLWSASFGVPKTGIHAFRSDWRMSWRVSLDTTVGKRNDTAIASAYFTINANLYDSTTGSSWGLPAPYSNSTYVRDSNSSSVRNFFTNLSLPFLVPVTHGDSYYFVIQLLGLTYATQGGHGAHAYAKLELGTVASGFVLTKVSL